MTIFIYSPNRLPTAFYVKRSNGGLIEKVSVLTSFPSSFHSKNS